jgi:tRNA1Val (adenine37-N6)-methyltransferase
MSTDIFRFKKFSVKQSDALMKVGTDGVLIGAAVSCNNPKRVLDIGTGTGLISLMIAQRCNAMIEAVDISEEAIELASENFFKSPFSSRLNSFRTSIQDFSPKEKYDLIVSNPPYFIAGNSAPVKGRAIARHNLELSLPDLFNAIKRLLKENGLAAIIYPALQKDFFVQELEKSGLLLVKRLFIAPKTGYEANRIIFEFAHSSVDITDSHIAIENTERHDFTEEYRLLTKEFYLKF